MKEGTAEEYRKASHGWQTLCMEKDKNLEYAKEKIRVLEALLVETKKTVEIYDHMQEVAKANGHDCLTAMLVGYDAQKNEILKLKIVLENIQFLCGPENPMLREPMGGRLTASDLCQRLPIPRSLSTGEPQVEVNLRTHLSRIHSDCSPNPQQDRPISQSSES